MEYAITIIGSGVGGLCAGALLSHYGYRTLVAESSSRLGGRCSTEDIDGFKLSTGAVAIHRGGALEDIYHQVGAKLELVDMPHQWYRIGSIEGQNFQMPAKGAIAALLDIASNLEENRAKMLGRMAREVATRKVMGFFGRAVRGKEEAEGLTFRDWLLQYTENDLAHKTFDAMACNVTSYHTYEVTAAEMFALFAGMGTYAALGVAPQGNEENMKSLAGVIQANGGEVWTDCPARQIIVEEGEAKGIVAQKDGKDVEILSRAVISNAGPRITVKLAGKGNFDQEYLSLTEKLNPVGMILVHVGSDEPLCLKDGELGGVLMVGLRRLTSAFPLTNFSPNLAPEGRHLLYCVGSPPSYLEPVNFDEELEQTTLDLKAQFPEFATSGRIVKFEVVFQDLPRPGRTRIPTKTPIENLYNVGDGVQELGSGGTSAAAESAREVANLIKKQIKL
ncbi:MAG: FAD-dependent oxidoreductase [Dehalococcoidia bacterium]